MCDHGTRPFKVLRMYCDASAFAGAGVGCLVLFGWAFHIEYLKSVLPGLVTMKANAALGLAFSGTSLWLLVPGESRTRRGHIARFFAFVVVTIGAATLIEYLFGLNLRIDQLLFNDRDGSVGTASPGRMAAMTATALMTTGLALILLDWKTRRGRQPAKLLSLCAALIAMVAISGYIFHAAALYGLLLHSDIAVHTAIALFLLNVAIFFARPRAGIADDFTSEGPGSVMARRLLPAAFCITIFLGWISLEGQLAGLYGTELGLALYSTANVVVLVVLVWLSARKINVEYRQRSRAEVEIRELNAELEGRVAERTKTIEKSELALRESSEMVRLLLDSTAEAIYGIDMGGNCTLCNRACVKMLGYREAADLLGKNMHDVMHYMREDRTPYPVEDCHIYRAFRQGKGSHVDDEVVWRSDGTNFPTEYWSYPIFRDEQVIGAVVTFIDITERRQAEVALRAATAIAEDSNRAKSEFLANMSHELRTPLNGVLGMTDLLLETGPTPEQLEYLETAQQSANSLLTLVNDILDFSKIEAGKMDLEASDFNLRDRLETDLEMLSVRADEKGLELVCDIAPEVPEVMRGDSNRLRQVVTNLVGNAIKFTEIGEVVLKVQVEADEATGRILHFIVSDTGVGIPADKQQVIFAPFSQADNSTTRKYGGSGLGLTISLHLVEKMGGKLWVDSEVGRGTHVHFTTRLRTPEKIIEVGTIVPPEILRAVKVLVVDDNRTNRRILEGMLRHWQMNPRLVENGEEALSQLSAAQESGAPYALVVSDMHMPGMDGFALIERIRQRPELSTTTIMMLTSAGHRGDAARCEELGVSAHLLKPIRQSELRQAIERVLRGQDQKEAIPPVIPYSLHDARGTEGAFRVLVAEDNQVNQLLTTRLLEKRGYHPVVVGNGREALEALQKENYDLVLMDVHMPEMDGLEATAAIRQREKKTGFHQPVIALTASVDLARCLAAGMDGHLGKPIQPEELDEVLEIQLAHRRKVDKIIFHNEESPGTSRKKKI
jgi:PAS domain S-box-containing protein